MFDVRLSTEQIGMRDTVRAFVRGEINPLALDPQRLLSGEQEVPAVLLAKAARMGLRSLALSEEAGGAGADTLTCCLVMEELGAGEANLAAIMACTSSLAAVLFNRLMSAEQCKRFLPAFLDDDQYHLACAALEGDAEQSWKYHRQRADSVQACITAERGSDGDWTIDGSAAFVANAPIAKLFAVQACTAAGDLVALLVPRDSAGIVLNEARTYDSDRPMVSWHLGTGASITFENCRVPGENRLGGNGRDSLACVPGTTADSMPQWAAINLGIGRAAYEAAVDYAKLRVQGARPIIQHQGIGMLLADVAIALSVARSAIWQAAWAVDHPDTRAETCGDLPLHLVAKVYTAEAMHKATERAAECFGAMGVMLDMPLPKYVRDARMFLQSGLSNTMAKLQIAEALAGFQSGSGMTR